MNTIEPAQAELPKPQQPQQSKSAIVLPRKAQNSPLPTASSKKNSKKKAAESKSKQASKFESLPGRIAPSPSPMAGPPGAPPSASSSPPPPVATKYFFLIKIFLIF